MGGEHGYGDRMVAEGTRGGSKSGATVAERKKRSHRGSSSES